MSGVPVMAVVVRWLTIASTAGLIGALVLRVVVLRAKTDELHDGRQHLRRWGLTCAVALTVATLAELVLRAQVMVGGSLSMSIAALPTVLIRTHFGTLWLVRLAALVVLLATAGGRAMSSALVALLASGVVALTESLTGHAADWGSVSLSVAVDWLHVLGACAWTGGLIGLGFVLTWARREWSPGTVMEVARRFSAMAGVCLALVLASGLYGAWVEVPAWPALWGTTYGRWLLLKVLLVLIIAGVGAVNRYVVLPRLEAKTGRTRLFSLIGREAGLAVVVFALTALLTESPPARHAYHMHTWSGGAVSPHDHTMSR